MREKDKELRRRRNRRKKLHHLKARLSEAKDPKEQARLVEKIKKISIFAG